MGYLLVVGYMLFFFVFRFQSHSEIQKMAQWLLIIQFIKRKEGGNTFIRYMYCIKDFQSSVLLYAITTVNTN